MISAKAGWMDFIGISFLNKEFKASMKLIVADRFTRLGK